MIVAYITSHGFGHAVRACETLRGLPPEIPVILRTRVPPSFLSSRMNSRPFTIEPAAFDCGTLGPDSRRVDLRATLDAIEPLLDANDARLDSEAEWLRRAGARLVVSDVPALPLAAARRAGVPSILLANFTWSAIYRHLLQFERPPSELAARLTSVIERLDAQYAQGDLLLIPGLEIPMNACRAQEIIGLVARRGRTRRAALARALDLDPSRPIFLVYLGRQGEAGMRWERLDRLRGLQLVGFAIPPPAESFIHPVPEDALDHADVAASVDGVVGKAGYGIGSECIASGTPLLYPPRPQFAEMLAVDRVMKQWGGGLPIPEDDFLSLQWRPYLDRLLSRRQPPERLDCSGSHRAVEVYSRAWRSGGITASTPGGS
jgi:hypothetical protein